MGFNGPEDEWYVLGVPNANASTEDGISLLCLSRKGEKAIHDAHAELKKMLADKGVDTTAGCFILSKFNDQTAICMDKAFPPEKYTPEPLCWVLTADIHPAPNAINQDWAVCKAPAGGRSEVCNMATEADVVPSVDVGDDDERIYPPPAVCDVVVDATIELLYYLAKSEVDDGTIIYAVEALFFAAAIKTYAHAFEKAIDEDDEESEWYAWMRFPPLLALLDRALKVESLERSGISMMGGYSHVCNLVPEYLTEADREDVLVLP